MSQQARNNPDSEENRWTTEDNERWIEGLRLKHSLGLLKPKPCGCHAYEGCDICSPPDYEEERNED